MVIKEKGITEKDYFNLGWRLWLDMEENRRPLKWVAWEMQYLKITLSQICRWAGGEKTRVGKVSWEGIAVTVTKVRRDWKRGEQRREGERRNVGYIPKGKRLESTIVWIRSLGEKNNYSIWKLCGKEYFSNSICNIKKFDKFFFLNFVEI